jgi:cyclopropane-fatty-acyl-phospholipid synthase
MHTAEGATCERSPGYPASNGFGARLVAYMIGTLRFGTLTIVLPSGAIVAKIGSEPGPDATIVLRRWRALRRMIIAGDIGFAEGYLEEDWTTPDLTPLIRLAAKNGDTLSPVIDGNRLVRLFNRTRHLLNANTLRGSRRNIQAHYDLGNNFYQEWLDPTMLYSSAIFDEATKTLEAAQQDRLTRIRKKLALGGGESILEIGFGWGALALDLATHANVNVVGITLSPSQLVWANTAAAAAGRMNQLDLRLQDYRETTGEFDRIVSIEMFEAVGQSYWSSYFDMIKRCMKAGGRTVMQIITIDNDRFEAYRGSIDFIQKYVFPGGFLPSVEVLSSEIAKAGLKITEIEHFGKSYAMTLHEWKQRFNERWPAIAGLGFDERFKRLWNYYLSYCEAGFEEKSIDVGFYTIEHA